MKKSQRYERMIKNTGLWLPTGTNACCSLWKGPERGGSPASSPVWGFHVCSVSCGFAGICAGYLLFGLPDLLPPSPPPCRSTPVPDPSTVMRMVLGWKVTAPAGWSCPHCAVSPCSGNCSLLPLFPLGPGDVKDTPGPLLLFLALSTLGYPLRLPAPLEIVSFISLSSYYPNWGTVSSLPGPWWV